MRVAIAVPMPLPAPGTIAIRCAKRSVMMATPREGGGVGQHVRSGGKADDFDVEHVDTVIGHTATCL